MKWWKKYCKRIDWRALLHPNPLILLAMTAVTATGLFWIFSTGRDYTLFACLFYGLSAYTLVVDVIFVAKGYSLRKSRKLLAAVDEPAAEESALDFGFYAEQFVNFFYGLYKIISGCILGSAWIGADGIYNFIQSLVQLYQILQNRIAKTEKSQWKSYHQCGFMMIVVHLTMTGLMFQMIQWGRHEDVTPIGIIATAAYTFYKLTKAVVDVAKDRKHKKPVDSAVYFLNLSQALYNLFVLQVGLLWVYGGPAFRYMKLMNTLTGGAVCLLVLGTGVYMIRRAKREMK